MKAKELIEALYKCPPDASVRFFVAWDDERIISQVSPEDFDGFVVVGDADLPLEKYARDYRHER